MLSALIFWLVAMLILYLIYAVFRRFAPGVDANVTWIVGVVLLIFALIVTVNLLMTLVNGAGFINFSSSNGGSLTHR